MFEKLKWYLIEIGCKKYAPVGIAAAFSAFGAYMAAHAGELQAFGVYYGIWPLAWPSGQEPVGDVLVVKMSVLRAVVGTAAIGLIAIAARAFQHHTTGTTTLPGGQRASDPPKTEQEKPQ